MLLRVTVARPSGAAGVTVEANMVPRGGRARRMMTAKERRAKEGYADARREITEEGEADVKTGGADNNV